MSPPPLFHIRCRDPLNRGDPRSGIRSAIPRITFKYDPNRFGGGDMEFLKYDTRRFFLFGVRLFFGAWLLYVGLSKWILMGPGTFVGYITGQFDKTWSPHALNVFLAW